MLLAEMNWSQLLLGTVIVGVCFFLVVVILLQRGRGGGLAGAFGGGGGSGTFGAKTGDVFTWITVAFAGVFLLLAIFANFVFDRSELALAGPVAAAPGNPIQTQTVTLPLEPGVNPEGVKVEMITEDGQVIPTNIETKVIDQPAGTPPGEQAPAPQGEQPQQPPQAPPSDPGTQTPPPADEPKDEGADEENKEPGR